MTIQELEAEFYEDLNGFIRGVSYEEDGLRIDFECDDWRSEERLFVTIQCEGALEWNVTPSRPGWLRVVADHLLLGKHNLPQTAVYFSSRPVNAYELSARLKEAQIRILGRFHYTCGVLYASPEILEGGHGLLARGPIPVVEAIHHAAEPYLTCSAINTYVPKGGLKLLEFDDCYVICKSVRIVDSWNGRPS